MPTTVPGCAAAKQVKDILIFAEFEDQIHAAGVLTSYVADLLSRCGGVASFHDRRLPESDRELPNLIATQRNSGNLKCSRCDIFAPRFHVCSAKAFVVNRPPVRSVFQPHGLTIRERRDHEKTK